MTWKIEGDTSKAHALITQLSWPETKEHVWTIVTPPSTKPGVRYPALPRRARELATDHDAARPGVALVEAYEYTSYDDVKAHGIHVLGEMPEEDGRIVLSLSGDIDF